jgi:hypothetical protein
MRVVVLTCVVLLLPLSVAVGEIYKWVDRHGAAHFTDNPDAVPAPYRDQIKTLSEPALPSPRPRLQPPAPQAMPVRTPHAPPDIVAPLQRVGNAMVVQAMLNGFVQVPLVVDTHAFTGAFQAFERSLFP